MSLVPADDLGPDDLTVSMITMNEEAAIGKVIDDIRAHVPNAEILVIDSSKDRTPEIAAAKGARVLRQFPPQGYGPAMDRALREGRGRVVVTLDCDDTYPAGMIAPLARLVLNGGYDLVDGSRLGHKPEAMPWINYLANAGFAAIASVMFGTWVDDLHSGMRAYRREMLDQLSFDPKGAALPVELLLVPMRAGYKVGVVHIDYHERIGVSTMQPLDSAKWTAKRILNARFRKISA